MIGLPPRPMSVRNVWRDTTQTVSRISAKLSPTSCYLFTVSAT
jgi:hypothetical protein